MTALMYAVKHGHIEIIQMFVKNKADLLITDAVSWSYAVGEFKGYHFIYLIIMQKKRTARDIAKSSAIRQFLYEKVEM